VIILGTVEMLILLITIWLVILATELFTVTVIKDKSLKVIHDIKENITNGTNKVEIITEEMEADMEEGATNEYYNRF
jgi:hypothetical protein